MEQENALLKKALEGDIHAFQELFAQFQDQLRSYLFRLLTNRNDAEDLTHDTFIRAFDKLSLFRGESSLKTWVFQMATNLAYNELRKRKRWTEDVSTQAKYLVKADPAHVSQVEYVRQNAPYGRYDIREHIDLCFTCISKSLPIDNQVALILKDIYDFSIKEIMFMLDKSEGSVKYLLQTARKTLTEVFDRRCALVNKEGICNQCSELNGWMNPKQQQQEALMKIKMVKEAGKLDKMELFHLRTTLVKGLDPLKSDGHELQDLFMKFNRMAMGEE